MRGEWLSRSHNDGFYATFIDEDQKFRVYYENRVVEL